jgi:hypothetical protein
MDDTFVALCPQLVLGKINKMQAEARKFAA